jgi:hypothetical protein
VIAAFKERSQTLILEGDPLERRQKISASSFGSNDLVAADSLTRRRDANRVPFSATNAHHGSDRVARLLVSLTSYGRVDHRGGDKTARCLTKVSKREDKCGS